MGMTLTVSRPTSQGKIPIGFLPYKFYGYRDLSTANSMDYLCRIVRKYTGDKDVIPAGLSEWFMYNSLCSVTLSAEEACIFVGLYVSDLIRYRGDIQPEELLGRFADIIIKLSQMNPKDEIELCWC